MDEGRLQGSGPQMLVGLIKKYGFNTDVRIEFATVTSAPPDLKIKVDNVNMELTKDDLVVAQYLCNHKRTVTIKSQGRMSTDGSGTATINSTSVGDSMTSAGYTPHTHDITKLDIVGNATFDFNGSFTVIEAEMEYHDLLKVGDRVIVAEIDNGQTYLIFDRLVTY